MKTSRKLRRGHGFVCCLVGVLLVLVYAQPSLAQGGGPGNGGGGGGGGGGGKPPSGETAGNNLSFPVIWAEGVEKVLREPPVDDNGDPICLLEGIWWYQWGTFGEDPDVIPASAPPDPDATNEDLNPDGLPLYDNDGEGVDLSLVAGTPAADNPLPVARAYLQKDPLNIWKADAVLPAITELGPEPVFVDRIDWGDNLESVDWYTRSQVRTEVVLYEDAELGDGLEPGVESYFADGPLREYEMRHTSGWGIDEVHGLATDLPLTLTGLVTPLLGPGTQATVYSHCARLTIQKLMVPREAILEGALKWVPEEGWTETDPEGENLVNPPIFNKPVHEGGDGPGYYSAEINVKGKIIYGYTWSVQKTNDPAPDGSAAGDYRITFSFDADSGIAPLNTFFVEGITEILVPTEEEVVAALAAESEETEGGAVGKIEYDENLTYIDVRILSRKVGGGKGQGKPRK